MEQKHADNAAWQATGRVPAFLDKWSKVNDKLLVNDIYNLHATHTVDDNTNGIAVRWTLETVQNRYQELIDQMVKHIVNTGLYTVRVMTKMYGTLSGVISEEEYAGLSDYESKVAEWLKRPGIEEFWKVFSEVVIPGGSNEVWFLWS
jgi:hypothetical protein